MILGKRVKNQGVSEEEHDFIIGSPMNHYGETHPHEGIDISKSCFFSLTPCYFLLLCKITVVVSN